MLVDRDLDRAPPILPGAALWKELVVLDRPCYISGSLSGLIKGSVDLQNSYLLSDLKLLVPPHAAKPQNRPPYFSIDTKPFDVWRLDVAVKGDFALGADVFFVNGVPLVNITDPANPVPRAILNFANLGDADGQGIAADSSFRQSNVGCSRASAHRSHSPGTDPACEPR